MGAVLCQIVHTPSSRCTQEHDASGDDAVMQCVHVRMHTKALLQSHLHPAVEGVHNSCSLRGAVPCRLSTIGRLAP